MVDESERVGAWDPNSDPDPEPGMPPRNITPLARPEPPGAQSGQSGQPSRRDPNAPPEGAPTAKSYSGGAMPERNFPKRCMWLTLPFYGWHIYAWVNAPDSLLDGMQKRLRTVRSPDDARVDPDDPAIDPNDFNLDPDEYGISNTERQARVNERARREREVERRRAEKAKRQEAYLAAKRETARFLGEIVMEHDIPDMEGNLIPADDVAFWDFAEGEVQQAILAEIAGQRGKLNPTRSGR